MTVIEGRGPILWSAAMLADHRVCVRRDWSSATMAVCQSIKSGNCHTDYMSAAYDNDDNNGNHDGADDDGDGDANEQHARKTKNDDECDGDCCDADVCV